MRAYINSTLPLYLSDFKNYIVNRRHNSIGTANNVISRLYKIHRWLTDNKDFKKRNKENWDIVRENPLIHVNSDNMIKFFDAHFHTTSANSRIAYKSSWNLFVVYAEIALGVENPIPDRHWKFIIIGKKNGKDKAKSELILTDNNIEEIIKASYITNRPKMRQVNTLILRTLIETGGRVNEVLSLKQGAIKGGEEPSIILDNKKTIQYRHPTRTVPITKDLYDVLQIYFAIHRVENEAKGFESLAFPSANNNIINHNYFRRKCIEPIAKHLNLKGLHPHLFRHYRISTWCETAITESDIAEVAYWAGNGVGTIRAFYLHVKK